MYPKLIKNDIKKNKLITITITAFILLAALFTSLACILAVNLFSAIDNMMIQAKSSHFMQMHAGEIDRNRLDAFIQSRDDIEDFQILEFLNIDGSEIIIGDTSLASSVQDNGFSTQSESFDFLLNLNDEAIIPADGEIYLPLYYMKETGAEIGETVTIRGIRFTIAGFLRDSQMNAAMVVSKRFLVSGNDFEKLRSIGRIEHLIEFRLIDGASIPAFETSYLNAQLESNGPPPITYPLIRMANAVTDGIMIAILVLINLLIIAVTFLCIRFTLLAKIEEDYKEIGVLKAVGLRVSNIKKIYLTKYGAMAAIACLFGFLLSLILQYPLTENVRLYMGKSNAAALGGFCGFTGAVLIFGVTIFYVNLILRRFRKISAAEAIRFGAPHEKTKSIRRFQLNRNKYLSTNTFLGLKDILTRKKIYVTILLVLITAFFILVVPTNIYTTMSSRNFMTYMGLGNCDMRIDIQQTENIPEKTAGISAVMAQDGSIAEHTVLTSYMFEMVTNDGITQRLKVELGDHSAFPIASSAGNMPENENEIAISSLYADDLEKTIGDTIVLIADGKEKTLTVCGIYSDLSNGGKTSKAIFETENTEVLWAIIPVKLHDADIAGQKVSEYKERFSFSKVSHIDEYMDQIFGSTIDSIQKVSYSSIVASIVLVLLITTLFFKMLIAKDRYSIAVIKSLGFTLANIRRQYMTRAFCILITAVILGTILANTLGESAGGALISLFGASAFHFVVNPLFAYFAAPVIVVVCVYMATRLGISDITSLNVSEHIKE